MYDLETPFMLWPVASKENDNNSFAVDPESMKRQRRVEHHIKGGGGDRQTGMGSGWTL
jgi:hypothetical protein